MCDRLTELQMAVNTCVAFATKNLEKETETKDNITSGTSDDLEIEIDIEKTKRRRQP